ncbi:MAG: hypothetical protein ACOZCL_14140 [Bacillota bacterium]
MKYKTPVIIILVIFILFIPIYKYNTFSISGLRGIGNDYNTNENYYIGYDLIWKGFIKPTITNAELIVENKDINDFFSVAFFIDENHRTGVINETSYAADKEMHKLVALENYKIKASDTQLVLRINFKNNSFNKNVKGIIVKYKFLGISKSFFISTSLFSE